MKELTTSELKQNLIQKLIEKMFEKEELDPDEMVLLMRAVGRYADDYYGVPDPIKSQMSVFIKKNEDSLETIFNSDIETIMEMFHESYINWDSQDTFETLATINEFYIALMGLWLVDEYDPTNGKAWSVLTDTTLFVEKNSKQFARSKQMVNHFHNPTSMNPIHDLWKAMKGHPTIVS
jgi:hypothetical protein